MQHRPETGMGLAGDTTPIFTSGFTLTGTIVTGVSNPQNAQNAFFDGETGIFYEVSIGAGSNIYNYVDNSPGSSIYTAGAPTGETASGTPDGEVIAIDSGAVFNAGTLNTYPLPPATGTTNNYQKTTDVIYVAGNGTVVNTGIIGDIYTISKPGNVGTPPYGYVQWDYVGILVNGGGLIENDPTGTVSGFNAITTNGNGSLDNYGTIEANNDAVLSTWTVTNHLNASMSTTTNGYADVHGYGDINNYGYMLGQDFAILAGGQSNVINDYAGAAVAGVTNFDGSQVFNGELSALVAGPETPLLTGNFSSYDAVNMMGTGSTLDLHAGSVNGTFYLPVIVGPMEGGFNSGTNLDNTLIFDFGGIGAGDYGSLATAIAQSLTGNASGTYYSGAVNLQGIHYQWEDFENVQLACFTAGTRIATPGGERLVETLQAGDAVLVAGAAPGPTRVRWVGSRRLDLARHRRPDVLQPIRIARDAFAPGVPHRDLNLSPDHAVLIDGVLIPIRHLANGSSIAPVCCRDVTYWHVELDRHDILLAEGLRVESYLDTGNRAVFADGGAQVQLHPDFAALSWEDACAELVQDGPRLAAAKSRLFGRAGIRRTRPMPSLAVEVAGAGVDAGVAAGVFLRCEEIGAGLLSCDLPPGTAAIRLISPVWVPAWCLADSLDQRRLGIRLFDILIDDGAAGLAPGAMLRGFHPAERTSEGPCRWTDGDARLALPPGCRRIVFRVGDGAVPAQGRQVARHAA